MLKINLEYRYGILFVRLSGNLNRRTSHKLNKHLIPVIMKHGIKFLVYNLHELRSIDGLGRKALLNGNKAIKSNKGFVYICDIPEKLESYFDTVPIQKTNNELSAAKLMAI